MSCERRRGGRGRKEGGLRGFLLVFSFERPRGCCEGGKKTKNQPKRKTRKIQLHSGVGNIYEFKDGEEGADGAAAGADGEALRALIGSNWIDPPKRERKRVATYNESDYYRQAMKLGGGGGGGPRASAAPRLPKMPALQDFQFYDVKRITALYEKEAAYETHRHSLAEKERSARAQGASEEVVQAQIAPGPDDPQPLSEEETAEREALLASGFANWNRRDFGAFIRACEKVSWRSDGDGGRAESAFSFIEKEGKRKRKLNLSPSFPRFSHSNSNKKTKTLQYGRDDPVRIASEIEGKTEAEVAAYLDVFRHRYTELNEHERLLRNIQRGEERLARHAEVAGLIRAKLAQYKNPWSELRLSYGEWRRSFFFLFFFFFFEREREREREKENTHLFLFPLPPPPPPPYPLNHHHTTTTPPPPPQPQQAPTRARPTPRRRTASSSARSRSSATAAGRSSRRTRAPRTASASTGTSSRARRRSWRGGATR